MYDMSHRPVVSFISWGCRGVTKKDRRICKDQAALMKELRAAYAHFEEFCAVHDEDELFVQGGPWSVQNVAGIIEVKAMNAYVGGVPALAFVESHKLCVVFSITMFTQKDSYSMS
jgi:hypothetical protein